MSGECLEAWKNKLYPNADDRIKHYNSDSFCIDYFVFGNCCDHECKQDHDDIAEKVIQSNVNRALLLLEYLKGSYDNDNGSKSIKRLIKIYEHLGDVHRSLAIAKTTGAASGHIHDEPLQKYTKSSKYYIKSFELSNQKHISSLFKLAKVSNEYLNDWDKSVDYYLQAINLVESKKHFSKQDIDCDVAGNEFESYNYDQQCNIDLHSSFARALKDHGMFNEAIYHFIQCIKILNNDKNDVNVNSSHQSMSNTRNMTNVAGVNVKNMI